MENEPLFATMIKALNASVSSDRMVENLRICGSWERLFLSGLNTGHSFQEGMTIISIMNFIYPCFFAMLSTV